MLNREQVTEQIREWMERVQAANAQLVLLSDMTGDLNYDAPFPAAVEALIEGYTAALSQIIGDDGEWLEYFRFNCAFGAEERVIGNDFHAQAQRAVSDDRTNVARTDQAQRFAGHFNAHKAVLFPLARLG